MDEDAYAQLVSEHLGELNPDTVFKVMTILSEAFSLSV